MQWLHDNHKLMIGDYHQQFCKIFNRTDVSKINLHSLRKRKGWKTGRTGQFKKGNIPHPNAKPKGPNKTSFKKGNRPHNWKPVGHERVNVEGYIEVKTAEPKTFELKHRVIWEQHNGPIPEEMLISFIDGNRQNCNINNLEMISKSENAFRNKMQINQYPQAIKPTIKQIAKLKEKIKEASA